MSDPKSTADLLKGELSRHSPMMARYLGMTAFVNGDKGLPPSVKLTRPS